MNEPVSAIARIQWQAFLILAVVFGTGAALGVAFERTRQHGPPPFGMRPPEGEGPDGPQNGPPRRPEPRTRDDSLRVPRYFEQLNPTDSQRLAIRALMEVQRRKADSVMAGVLPRLRAITDSTFDAIGALLTPEQLKLYEATKPQRGFLPMPGQGRSMRRGGPPGMHGEDGRPEDRRGPPGEFRGPPPDGMGPPPFDGPPPDGRRGPPPGERPKGPPPERRPR